MDLKADRRGITLIETVFWAGMMSAAALWAARLPQIPLKLTARLNRTQQIQALDRGIGLLMQDLRGATIQGISNVLTKTESKPEIDWFARQRYNNDQLVTYYVKYGFDAGSSTLWRYETEALTPAI